MYSKPGSGLGSAQSRRVEQSFKNKQPLKRADEPSPAARKALAERDARRAEQARHRAIAQATAQVAAAARARRIDEEEMANCDGSMVCLAKIHMAMCQSQMSSDDVVALRMLDGLR